MTNLPFEATFPEISKNPDLYVDSVFSSLESEFLMMPKGVGFVEYATFEEGYEALKQTTGGFRELEPAKIVSLCAACPIALIVLRTMLGFTPPEWGFVATEKTSIDVPQGYVRTLDRRVRKAPTRALRPAGESAKRLSALIQTACMLLSEGAPTVDKDQLHRLDKADTKKGLESIRTMAAMGVPYAMLLYERFLGRPFAAHRDSVSEIVGDRLESAIEEILVKAGISFRKTKRAERVEGFDQAPDFIIPSEFGIPQVVIEAKIAEDDGTARDKTTRIQHLGDLSVRRGSADKPAFEVIACIGGRGFMVRREDIKKVILATRGKVFTAKTLDKMIDHTRLGAFVPAPRPRPRYL